MPKDVLLSICIISYNTRILTCAAVASAAADCSSSELLKKTSEVIIVDNNSQDDSVAALKEQTQHLPIPAQLIVNKENSGFAAANNQAIQQAKGKYILLLNSDTEVIPGALEKLVMGFELVGSTTTATLASAKGELDNLGICAASLRNADGTPQPQGGSFPTLISLACQMLFLDDIPVLGKLLPSTQHTGWRAPAQTTDRVLVQQDWVGGTALMISRACLEEIGLLDEQIFMYGEDIEWCMRAHHKHWDVAINTKAEITHFGSASGGSEHALLGEFKGYLYIWALHKPLWQQNLAALLLKTGALLRVVLFATINRRERAKIYWRIYGYLAKNA